MDIKKIRMRPEGDNDYDTIVHPETSVDMVVGLDATIQSAIVDKVSQSDFDEHLAENVTEVHGGIVPDTRKVIAGTGLKGGGDLTADRTVSVDFGTGSNNAARGNHSHSEYTQVITGTYIGNLNDSNRTINIGVTPKYVIVQATVGVSAVG